MSALLVSALFIAAAMIMPGVAQQVEPEQVEPEPAPAVESDAAQDASTEYTPVGSTSARTEPATRFNPTEKIRADEAVSFPVDI